jgi:hypothetical protein
VWKTQETTVDSVTVGMVVVAPNVERVAVFITNILPQTVHLSTLPPPYADANGIAIKQDDTRILQWSTHGQLARDELRCVDPQPAQTIHVLEVLYWETGGNPND